MQTNFQGYTFTVAINITFMLEGEIHDIKNLPKRMMLPLVEESLL